MQVKVVLSRDDGNYIVAVQDNGKGIQPDEADRIFSPYFTTKHSGSGLGLAISKQAIEQMKGKIWFETVIGKGSTFFVSLPVLTTRMSRKQNNAFHAKAQSLNLDSLDLRINMIQQGASRSSA